MQGGDKEDKGALATDHFDIPTLSRPVTSVPDALHKSIDTGKAALLAYTNLDPSPQLEESVSTDWRKGQNTRNVAISQSSGGGEPKPH